MPVYQLAASSAHLNWNGFQSFLCKAPTVSRFLKTCSSSVCLLPSKHIVVGCAPKWSKSSLAPCSNIFKRPLKPASACKRYKCCSWMFMAAFMTPYVLLHYEQVWTGPRFPSIVSSHTSSHNVRPGRWPRSTFRLSLCLSLLHFFILKLCDSYLHPFAASFLRQELWRPWLWAAAASCNASKQKGRTQIQV